MSEVADKVVSPEDNVPVLQPKLVEGPVNENEDIERFMEATRDCLEFKTKDDSIDLKFEENE